MDYVDAMQTVTFVTSPLPTPSRLCSQLIVLDDSIFENSESLMIDLSTTVERVTLQPSSALVIIQDDDRMCINPINFHCSIMDNNQ